MGGRGEVMAAAQASEVISSTVMMLSRARGASSVRRANVQAARMARESTAGLRMFQGGHNLGRANLVVLAMSVSVRGSQSGKAGVTSPVVRQEI